MRRRNQAQRLLKNAQTRDHRYKGDRPADSHWEVINFLREGYQATGTVPNMRALTKSFTKVYGPEKGDSKYLYGLFPYGPAKQACRISGLPKPTGCV